VASLEIGLTPWRYDAAAPAEALVEQAVRAESLGFRSFWLPESHFTGAGANPAPLLLLAALAARTRSIRLATTSFLLPIRNALQVAEEVAVLDCLSGGRVILGVGRGFRAALFAAYGVPVKEKRDRFEAALSVMLDAWAGKPVTPDRDGAAVVLAPLPLQQPHPPIWVAAFGPKALAQAGRLGLPYLASPIEPFERLRNNYAAHREAIAETHGELELDVPVMRTVFAHPDSDARARVSAGLERQAAALASAPQAAIRKSAPASIAEWALVGEPAAIADEIARHRETLGVTHLIARTQLPGVDELDLLESLEHLAGLAESAPAI
jgi:alkanesulfonate monooxygenase SsuD/methylene tetrahydromethanopterin reductase-like flavin-dependent oxidoreductase (luciferase family)